MTRIPLIVLLIIGMLLMTLGSVGVNAFWPCGYYYQTDTSCYGSYVSSSISVAIGTVLTAFGLYFVWTSCSS